MQWKVKSCRQSSDGTFSFCDHSSALLHHRCHMTAGGDERQVCHTLRCVCTCVWLTAADAAGGTSVTPHRGGCLCPPSDTHTHTRTLPIISKCSWSDLKCSQTWLWTMSRWNLRSAGASAQSRVSDDWHWNSVICHDCDAGRLFLKRR